MSTAAQPAIAPSTTSVRTSAERPAATHPSARTTASTTSRTARYALATTRQTLTNIQFVFFTVGLPVIMFLLVNGIYGNQGPAGEVTRLNMMNMAAYGALTAAVNAGALIQLERANGWLRQLMVAGMTPTTFVTGKLCAAMAVVLPTILAVVAAGLLSGADVDAPRLIGAIALMWLLNVPMVMLGLTVGLAVKPSAVSAVATITTILLAVVGGLWFPTLLFPDWLAEISVRSPAHWLGALPLAVLQGDPIPMQGVLTVVVWTVIIAVACVALLRRGARTTSRR